MLDVVISYFALILIEPPEAAHFSYGFITEIAIA
jgi:hypothetical protein